MAGPCLCQFLRPSILLCGANDVRGALYFLTRRFEACVSIFHSAFAEAVRHFQHLDVVIKIGIKMRLEELFDKAYAPRVSIHLDDVIEEDKGEIAGMLRGLMCAIEGWGSISGFTNEVFTNNSIVILSFSNVDNAHRFKDCVEYYFSTEILEALKVKKRVYRA